MAIILILITVHSIIIIHHLTLTSTGCPGSEQNYSYEWNIKKSLEMEKDYEGCSAKNVGGGLTAEMGGKGCDWCLLSCGGAGDDMVLMLWLLLLLLLK